MTLGPSCASVAVVGQCHSYSGMKYELLERRVADCSDDWSQDMTGKLAKWVHDLVYTA